MDPWHIPALQHTSHMWHIAEEAPVSRSRRSRGNGPYESAVPITLSDLTLDVPAPLMALIEDASVALAQFDGIAAHHLGGQIHTLGPMSAVLLRTEATSSSQIEHLTVGAKNLAMELLHKGNSENAAVVVGNVRAMESALRLSADLNVERTCCPCIKRSFPPNPDGSATPARSAPNWYGWGPIHTRRAAPRSWVHNRS